MSRYCILTEKEFQLMTASTRSDRIPGMEELSLTYEKQLDQSARDTLVEKKLLVLKDNGRFGPERKVGYIFSGLAHCVNWVRGDILYPDGCTARLNLYLFDGMFESLLWKDSNTIECTWMSNYPLAMGCILHYLNQPGKGKKNAQQLQEDALLHSISEYAQKELSSGVKAVFAFTENLIPEQNNVHFYIVAQDGLFYRACLDQNELRLVCQPLQDLVQELSQNIYIAHQREITEVTHEQN